MWRSLVQKLLPPPWREALLRKYRVFRRRRLAAWPQTTEEEFRRIVTDELGLRRGAVVFVHSATDRLNLGFSFFRVLPILRETVGPAGTLLFPCTHVRDRAEDYLRRGDVFSVRNAVTTMGILPELVRRLPDAVRSLHPTNSVVAVGKYARELTDTHSRSVYPCGEESPYFKIMQYDGRIVGLGVTTAKLSFVHCVEDVWRDRFPVRTRTPEVFPARVIDQDGAELIVPTVAQSRVTQVLTSHSVPRFIRRHVAPAVCRELRSNGVEYFAADARRLYARLEELAGQGVTIYGRPRFAALRRA
ncbi:MAG: AAC(3) family N-acetyltransferase [Planctomycetota bacterium]|nr:AAC(3) family N-acetyltransferase [Planctomycetota bacterium]